MRQDCMHMSGRYSVVELSGTHRRFMLHVYACCSRQCFFSYYSSPCIDATVQQSNHIMTARSIKLP
jgi:hypothetical protein